MASRSPDAYNFDKLRDQKASFIDRTLLIKEFMDDDPAVVCIHRPHGSGKSTNLSMLRAFLSVGAIDAQSKFENNAIGLRREFMDEHCAQYPVVQLSWRDCRGDNWPQMYHEIWLRIQRMVAEHAHDLSHWNLAAFQLDELCVQAPERQELVEATLHWLMGALHAKHRKRVIVLIDDYDSPLTHAYQQGFYDEAAEFFASFYSTALQQDDGTTLEKACLMGVGCARNPPGLDNTVVYSDAEEQYSEFFRAVD